MVVVLACSSFSGVTASCSSSCGATSTSSAPSSSRGIMYFPYWKCRKSRLTGVCWSGTREVRSKELITRVVATEVTANGETESFLDARSEEDIIYLIQKRAESGKITENIATGMKILYHNYRNAVLKSKNPLANDVILSNMAVALDRILFEVEDPFTFLPHHRAIREPFDYYTFGQNYIRPLIDFRTSYIGNISIFQEVEEKLRKGHNVIFVSNHQTEADPAVIALLLETTNPFLAEKLTYIAGDRVVTDPFCKPFSMGRNLICVYSKNHLYDIPELADMKKKANTRSLKAMAMLLRDGGKLIWIAPSGGRDRPDSLTGELHPAPFDASSVDNIRRLADHSTVEGHIYPLSLLCYDIMPPPHQVEKEIGEQRRVSFHGVGLSIGHELKFDVITSTSETAEEAKNVFSQALYNSVSEQYDILKSAIYGHDGDYQKLASGKDNKKDFLAKQRVFKILQTPRYR